MDNLAPARQCCTRNWHIRALPRMRGHATSSSSVPSWPFCDDDDMSPHNAKSQECCHDRQQWREDLATILERFRRQHRFKNQTPGPSVGLSDSVRLAMMGAAEAKTCASRLRAAEPMVCQYLG